MSNWFKDGNVDMVLGLQWGSEGKGSIAGYLARKVGHDLLISCSGANSGHTWMGFVPSEDGGSTSLTKLVHRHLPLGIVSPTVKDVLLGPGAIINPEILKAEVAEARAKIPCFKNVTVGIHPHAAVIYPRHVEEEGGKTGTIGIGSTMKGNGAAIREKLLRHIGNSMTGGDIMYDANIAGNAKSLLQDDELGIEVIDEPAYYMARIKMARQILFEGAQGYGLSLNSGPYPYVTSRECSPAQMCADAMLAPQMIRRVIGVVRTFPIRVANRYDEKGAMVGWSGPHFPDQEEMTWQALGQAPEYTTVTKLERRVFSPSRMQLQHAIEGCRPDEIALTFCDYAPELVDALINEIQGISADQGSPALVRYTAWGPHEHDIKERRLLDPCDYGAGDGGYTTR